MNQTPKENDNNKQRKLFLLEFWLLLTMDRFNFYKVNVKHIVSLISRSQTINAS